MSVRFWKYDPELCKVCYEPRGCDYCSFEPDAYYEEYGLPKMPAEEEEEDE